MGIYDIYNMFILFSGCLFFFIFLVILNLWAQIKKLEIMITIKKQAKKKNPELEKNPIW